MNASGESDKKALLPAQETQQPPHLQKLAPLGRATLPVDGLDAKARKRPSSPEPRAKAALDQARFTAGIVQFYEAVLSEAVPEKMLLLVEEIAKRERDA